MMTYKEKAYAVIRATRPQFLFAYIVLYIAGLVIGKSQSYPLPSSSLQIAPFVLITINAIGIHFRDEAADWNEGYDVIHGGAGVIREGLLTSKSLATWGISLNIMGIMGLIISTYYVHEIIIITIPSTILLLWPHHITENIFLGHEVGCALSFWAALLFTYLYQGWPLTVATLLFSIFAFILAFSLVPYQDIGDYEVDKRNGKKTLTAYMGLEAITHLSIALALVSLFFLYGAMLML